MEEAQLPACRHVRAQKPSRRLSAVVLLLSGFLPPLSPRLSATEGKQVSLDIREPRHGSDDAASTGRRWEGPGTKRVELTVAAPPRPGWPPQGH